MSSIDCVGESVSPVIAGYIFSSRINQVNKIPAYFSYQFFGKYIKRIQCLCYQLF